MTYSKINLDGYKKNPETIPADGLRLYTYSIDNNPDGPDAGTKVQCVGTFKTPEELIHLTNVVHGCEEVSGCGEIGYAVKRPLHELALEALGSEAVDDILKEASYFADGSVSSDTFDKYGETLRDIVRA